MNLDINDLLSRAFKPSRKCIYQNPAPSDDERGDPCVARPEFVVRNTLNKVWVGACRRHLSKTERLVPADVRQVMTVTDFLNSGLANGFPG